MVITLNCISLLVNFGFAGSSTITLPPFIITPCLLQTMDDLEIIGNRIQRVVHRLFVIHASGGMFSCKRTHSIDKRVVYGRWYIVQHNAERKHYANEDTEEAT